MTWNWFVIVAFLFWPIVAGILYRTKPIAVATVWTVLGGLLLLPSTMEIKFEMIPAFDKNSIPNVCAVIGCLFLAPRQRRLPIRSRLADLIILVYLFSPVFTSAFNNDAIQVGGRVLPGVGNYDAISAGLRQLIFFLPFLVGRRFLRSADDIKIILRALVVAGLVYSVPMLFEIRMSPQLSNLIYGYFPSTFSTEGRYGGFRPVVFMINGLALAFFIMTSLLASIALWRTRNKIREIPASGISVYLGAILMLCKSAGALAYGMVAGFLVGLATPRLQSRIAILLVSIGLLYPLLRITDLFPTRTLVSIAGLISEERSGSLEFRFRQEDRLLERASQRFMFGWGRFGRSRLYEESGDDSSTTDGLWIIILGSFGIVGFLAQFGLLALPVFSAVSTIKLIESKSDSVLLAALAMIVALTVIEQLPNASVNPWSWLLAGALLGRTEFIKSTAMVSRKRRPRLKSVEANFQTSS